MPTPKFIPKPGGLDLELNLYTKVLKLESLHWGYWKDIKELSMRNLKIAQDAYTSRLLAFVPKNVKTVLDIGAGIGDNAMRFAKRGYKVKALTPEPNQIEVFKKLSKENKHISFIQSKWEDLTIDAKFDLILMSESSNYFALQEGMNQTARYLGKDGYLLVAGLFRKTHSEVFPTWNVMSDFEKEASNHGLKLLKKEDISDSTAPSMQLGYEFYEKYGKPFIEVITDYYKKAFKWKVYLISLFFGKELYILRQVFYKELPDRLDVTKFKKYGRYLIYLYQKT